MSDDPNPIGFRLDTEDEDECAEPQQVGDGCASLTPTEAGTSIAELVRETRKLRRMGATKVQWGEFIVEFGGGDGKE